jgi:hypothetical protein
MASVAWLHPPADVLALGPPERVFYSRQKPIARIIAVWTLILLALLGSAALLIIRFYTKLIPHTYLLTVDMVSGVTAGCAAFSFLVVFAASLRKPDYLYAFYPQGLVIYQQEKWGYLPWYKVLVFEQQAKQPYLFLENRQQVNIDHDFRDARPLCAALASYVYRKDPHTIDVPRDKAFSIKDELGAWLQLGLGVALIAGSVSLAVLYWDGIIGSFQPVKSVSHKELATLGNPIRLQRSWASLACPRVYPTKATITRKETDGERQSKLVLIPIEDRFLVANVNPTFQGNALLRGDVSNWKDMASPVAEKKKEALDQVFAEFPKLKEKFLSYQFDAIMYEERQSQLLAYVLATIVLIGTTLLVRSIWFWQRLRPEVLHL